MEPIGLPDDWPEQVARARAGFDQVLELTKLMAKFWGDLETEMRKQGVSADAAARTVAASASRFLKQASL